jgi:hypothetical protein
MWARTDRESGPAFLAKRRDSSMGGSSTMRRDLNSWAYPTPLPCFLEVLK